jgi:Tol biopolymer transport system component
MGVFWAPDNQHLFFSTHSVGATGEQTRLWKADYAGSDPDVTEVEDADGLVVSAQVVVSPDGTRIAFVAGRESGEVWMMTNLAGGGR